MVKKEIVFQHHPGKGKGRGYHLTIGDRTWSLVNLGQPPVEYADVEMAESVYEDIGKSYDTMGGRYEAMDVPNFEFQFRGG